MCVTDEDVFNNCRAIWGRSWFDIRDIKVKRVTMIRLIEDMKESFDIEVR